MKTTDPTEAWAQSHLELVKLDRVGRIGTGDLSRVLGLYCRGTKAEKDTIKWALEQGLLHAFFEEIPTEYTLTDLGRAWKGEGEQ